MVLLNGMAGQKVGRFLYLDEDEVFGVGLDFMLDLHGENVAPDLAV